MNATNQKLIFWTLEDASVTEALHRLVSTFRCMNSLGHRHPSGYHEIIMALGKHEGISPRRLSDLLAITAASLTELLEKMEADGFIIRRKDEKNPQAQRILLSPMGKAHLEEVKEIKADEPLIAEILSPEERQTLINLCNKLAEGLADHAETAINS